MIPYNKAQEKNKYVDIQLKIFQENMKSKYHDNIVPAEYSEKDKKLKVVPGEWRVVEWIFIPESLNDLVVNSYRKPFSVSFLLEKQTKENL